MAFTDRKRKQIVNNKRYYPQEAFASAVEDFKRSTQMTIRENKIDSLIGKSDLTNLITNTILKIKYKYGSNSKR
jgi:hypothetical protein